MQWRRRARLKENTRNGYLGDLDLVLLLPLLGSGDDNLLAVAPSSRRSLCTFLAAACLPAMARRFLRPPLWLYFARVASSPAIVKLNRISY